MTDVEINYDRENRLFRLTCVDHLWEIFVRGEHVAHAEAEQHEKLRHNRSAEESTAAEWRHNPTAVTEGVTVVEDEHGLHVQLSDELAERFEVEQAYWESESRSGPVRVPRRNVTVDQEEDVRFVAARCPSCSQHTLVEEQHGKIVALNDENARLRDQITHHRGVIEEQSRRARDTHNRVVALHGYIRAVGQALRLRRFDCCGGVAPHHLPDCTAPRDELL